MNLEVINILSFYHASKIQFHVSENETLNPLREPLFDFDFRFVLARYWPDVVPATSNGGQFL
jgi:hypothetical protein